MITEGLKNKIEITVTQHDTAKALGSGELEVLATPRMVALMEECAYKSLSSYLENGSGTVGTLIEVKHLSATPVGMSVWAESVVTKVDGRCVSFEIKAYDECGLIGEAIHQRFIVFNEKFVQKTYSKLK